MKIFFYSWTLFFLIQTNCYDFKKFNYENNKNLYKNVIRIFVGLGLICREINYCIKAYKQYKDIGKPKKLNKEESKKENFIEKNHKGEPYINEFQNQLKYQKGKINFPKLFFQENQLLSLDQIFKNSMQMLTKLATNNRNGINI